LKRANFVVDEEKEQDGESYCAVVESGRIRLDDLNWFRTALEAAAGQPAERA